MKNYIFKLFTIFALFFSCNESEEPEEAIIEEKQFERVENFLFNYEDSDVQRIKVIGDRLIFSNRSNPGYIDSIGEVVQLCCFNSNSVDFRQSFSSKYIVAANRSLRFYSVYDVEGGISGGLSLSQLIPSENSVQISLSQDRSNFDLNDDLFITTLQVDGVNRIFIFDLKEHFWLYGQPLEVKEPVEVKIPSINPQIGPFLINVDAFEDGWIASISTADQTTNGTYFIRKDGSYELLFPLVDFTYTDHEYTSKGQLLLGGSREVRISQNERIDGINYKITSSNNFKFGIIDDRLVVWPQNGSTIYELEGYMGPDEIVFKPIKNIGLEFSKLNEIAFFNGKVYLATTQGLFTKSLEDFWDFIPEEEISSFDQDFINQIEINKDLP